MNESATPQFGAFAATNTGTNQFATIARNNLIIWKICTIAILILGALIPLGMISGLIYERQSRKDEVTKQISANWGGKQTILGPVLVLPYQRLYGRTNENGEKETKVMVERAYLFPRQYTANSDIKSEIRHRGMYNATVYTSNIAATGQFNLDDLQELKIPFDKINWNDAFVVMTIPQPKSLQAPPNLQWQGHAQEMFPGTNGSNFFDTGLYAPVTCNQDSKTIPFTLKLILKGSESFSLVPIGKENKLQISSDWKTPSFTGSISPTNRNVSATGFTAEWQIPYFARSYSQAFTDTSEKLHTAINDSQVGVDFYSPVDFYRQAERAIKYGILFLTLTFSTYFLFEVIGKVKVHPLQYLLVGSALCLFYLLLLALSEVIGFTLSYAIATLAIVTTITLYSKAIMSKARKHTHLVIAGLLSLLYTYLYVLLRLEDMSLLFGTIGLFIVLVSIMYVTRNIDWYSEGQASTAQAT